MTNGGEEKQGSLLLPNQAIEERVLFPYVKEFPEHLEIIKPNSNYTIKT